MVSLYKILVQFYNFKYSYYKVPTSGYQKVRRLMRSIQYLLSYAYGYFYGI